MNRSLAHALMHPALLSLTLLSARSVYASDTTSDRVADLYKKANALYDQKKLPEAEALYDQAWELKKTYDIACNLGAIELDLGKPRAAAEHLAYALHEFPAGGKTSARELIEGRFKHAREQVGVLRVRVNVEGAQVVIAGRAIGKSPVDEDVFVDPGAVTVEASLAGYSTAHQTLQVDKGGASEASLILRKPRRSVVPAIVIGGVGLAALGVGGAFIGIAEGKKADAKKLGVETNHACPVGDPSPQGKCKDLASTAASADAFGNIGVVGLVVAGAAAAGAVTYLLWPAPRDEAAPAAALRVVPSVGLNGGGLLLSGAF